MNRHRPCLALALFLSLFGCGGGNPSGPSPFAGNYRQTAREDLYLANNTVNYTVYGISPTTTTVMGDGRFLTTITFLYRDSADALHTQVDTLDGTVHRGGGVSQASRKVAIDGVAQTSETEYGGTGRFDVSSGYTEVYLTFPGAPEGGTYRYDLSPKGDE